MIKIFFILIININVYSKAIDFQQALDLSLSNNKELLAKKLSIYESKLLLQETKNYNYGSLLFNSTISKTNNAGHVFGMKLASREATFRDFGFSQFGQPMDTQPVDLNFPQDRTNFENKISYDIPLFTGYKLSNAEKMAKLQLLANKVKYNYDKKNLGLEILKAYNGAVTAKYLIEATKNAQIATNSFVNLASELYKEGFVTQIDIKQAKVHNLNVKTKVNDAFNRFELSIAYLKFLTNDKNITDIKDFENINFTKNELSSLQNIAINNRDDLNWMDYNKKTLKTKVQMEKAVKYPQIGAHIEYGFNNNTFDNFNSNHDSYTAAIGLKYSLFNPNSQIKIDKSKIEYKKATYYFEYMKDAIKLEVEKNLLTLISKKNVLAEKLKAKELAQEILEQSKEMYQNNLINMTNLLMQQANDYKANAEVIMSKYETTMSSAKLKLSLGLSLKE